MRPADPTADGTGTLRPPEMANCDWRDYGSQVGFWMSAACWGAAAHPTTGQ